MKELRKDESVVQLHPSISISIISKASDARDDMKTYWLIQPPVSLVNIDLDAILGVHQKANNLLSLELGPPVVGSFFSFSCSVCD